MQSFAHSHGRPRHDSVLWYAAVRMIRSVLWYEYAAVLVCQSYGMPARPWQYISLVLVLYEYRTGSGNVEPRKQFGTVSQRYHTVIHQDMYSAHGIAVVVPLTVL